MKYLIEVSQRQFEEIKRLISQDKYRDLPQFIDTAIENQLHIEKADIAREYIGPITSFVADDQAPYKEARAEGVKISLAAVPEKNCLALSALPSDIKTVEAPADSRLRFVFPEAGPDNNWLWGQINRIFPIKTGIRYLASMLVEGEFLDLNVFREKGLLCPAALEARLKAYEENSGVDRDKCISTGLPGAGRDDYKSHDRYRNQVLAVLRKDGKLDGALSLHKFINITEGAGKPRIGITKAGLEFALLENPVLDRNDFTVSLSEAERDFYVRHIRNNMPGEYNGVKWTLSAIKEGKSRDEINAAMAEYYKPYWGEPSAEFITTQRAGMIARLSELGLITKEKTGVKVRYLVTEKGLSLI